MTQITPSKLAAQLQSTHAHLYACLSLLEPSEIEETRLSGGWTPKVLLAHVAFWDDYQTQRMQEAYRGALSQQRMPTPALDNDQRAFGDIIRSWEEVVAAADEARQRMVDFAQQLPTEAMMAEYREGEQTLSLARLLEHMVRHTRDHSREIQQYCGSLARWGRLRLRSFLVQNHATLMDSISGLTEQTMLATRVCGIWTIRDVLAHVLSWNEYGYRVMQQWPKPNMAGLQAWLHGADATENRGCDTINERLLAAREHLDLIAIADGLTTYHRRLLRLWDDMSDEQLASQGEYGWGEIGEAARFFYEFSLHEIEHAEQIWRFRTAGVH